jgi:membrane protein DedA with SNARE-associated domain
MGRFRFLASWVSWQSLAQLGGPGLVLFGIVDQSFIPVPGGMDALTIVLSAREHARWPYFAAMATLGTVIGAYITYSISRRGGKETLEKKVPPRQIQKIEKQFSKRGFAAVFVPCLLPPPLPAVAFLAAAGALQFPRRKFLLAVTTGRAIRYSVIAFFGHIYGRAILRFFSRYETAIIVAFLVLMVGATLGGFLYRKWQIKRDRDRGDDKNEDGSQQSAHLPDPGLLKTGQPPPIPSDPRQRRAG